MTSLKDFVRPYVARGATTADIADAAMSAGVAGSRKSVGATVSAMRRKEFGREPLARGKGALVPLPERVNAYFADVAKEYGVTVSEVRVRLLTIICDDDLAHAVLGDPPPKRPVGRPACKERKSILADVRADDLAQSGLGYTPAKREARDA